MDWKSNLGAFMQKHEHYNTKEINTLVITPLIDNLINEFSRYDDFTTTAYVSTDTEKGIEITYLTVKPNCYPNYFSFEIQIWFEKGKVFINNNSLDVFQNLKDTLDVLLEESEKTKNTESFLQEFDLEEAFKTDYLATIIIRMFISYYEHTCRQNKLNSLEVHKGLIGC